MQKTIVVVEPVCAGREHSSFNAAIMEALARLTSHVVFLGDQSHLAAVEGCLPATVRPAIDFRPLSIAPRRLQTFHRRFRLDWSVFSHAWATADREQAAAILSTGITEP